MVVVNCIFSWIRSVVQWQREWFKGSVGE